MKTTTTKPKAVASKTAKVKSVKKPELHCGPFRVAACWPHQDAPLVMSMVGARQIFIATSFSQVAVDVILAQTFDQLHDRSLDEAIAFELPRYIFALPYDYFAISDSHRNFERPLAWEIYAGLVWDLEAKEPRYVALPDASKARFHLDSKSAIKELLADAKKHVPIGFEALELFPSTSDETYLESVRSVLDGIKNGDFYQVNLLRYFNIARAQGWEALCDRMEKQAGPHGSLTAQGSKVVASFSPEKFIEVSRKDSEFLIETWPIKGTSKRCLDDDAKDQKLGESLLESEKDQAELRMIIDLMRNDLTRICEPMTVEVAEPMALKKFQQVWHLEGHVRGTLNLKLTLGEVLKAICPGGSITGAPKIAAMKRIELDERQPRGFFMGNFFRINRDGSLCSNIMIRTLVSDNWMRSAKYAAGSGIVIKSDPSLELQEINSKCAILTCASES